MVSPAYVIGALDALVKAGEVSPAYADGVVSVLEKKALWPAISLGGAIPAATYGAYRLFRNSPRENLMAETDKFYAGKPKGYKATAQEKAEILDRSRYFNDGKLSKGLAYAGNRWRAFKSWIDPTDPRTAAHYDREWENWKQKDRADYISRNFDTESTRRMWDTIAGAENHNSNMANAYYTSANKYMTPGQRRAAGIPGSPRNVGLTPMVNSMISGGLYQLDHDYDKPKTPARTYGQGVPEYIYGANRNMFYDRSRIR